MFPDVVSMEYRTDWRGRSRAGLRSSVAAIRLVTLAQIGSVVLRMLGDVPPDEEVSVDDALLLPARFDQVLTRRSATRSSQR